MTKANNNELRETMGKNIRHLRLQYKYTADDLAGILEISSGFMGLIERGERGLSLKKLIKLIEVFGVKFEDLIKSDFVESEDEVDFSKQVIALAAGFTDSEKYVLINLLREYLKSRK